jgi:hypothetical protein
VAWHAADAGDFSVEQLNGSLDHRVGQDAPHHRSITGCHRSITGERPAITGITGAARGGGGQANINGGLLRHDHSVRQGSLLYRTGDTGDDGGFTGDLPGTDR